MITVKIPAAIRVCSPVVCVSLPDVGSFEIGERHVIKSTEDSSVNVNGWWTPRACWTLIISDPTGAAHLAWWLSARIRSAVEADGNWHPDNLAALGISGMNFYTAHDNASRGVHVDTRGLEILRDYAHRVAGATNG